MTCAEADRIRREGPGVVVERLDGVARVILTCSVDYADIIKARLEQMRCARQLAEGNPETEGLKLGLADNLLEELEIVYGIFTSFEDSGVGKLQSQSPQDGGRDAARVPGLDGA